MSNVDYVFWLFLLFGCFALLEKNRLILVVLIFIFGLILTQTALDWDGFLSYQIRFASLIAFGAMAIKLRVFGVAALFLFLLGASMLMYVSDVHYLVVLVFLSAPVFFVVIGRNKNHLVKQSRILSAVEFVEDRMESAFKGLFCVAAVFPFLFIFLKRFIQ